MMVRTPWRAAVPSLLLVLASWSGASAAWVGDRFFPSTLATTVPTPADFLNLPTFARLPATTSTRETDIGSTYSKLITPDWALTFTETYRILDQANTPTLRGFENLVLGTQYALYTNPEHEFIFTVGGTAQIGGTGSRQIGAASFSTLTPTIYVGKGFGDLPDSMAWLRPVNVTANLGVAVPTRSTTLATSTLPTGTTAVTETVNPNILLWSFALEYSLLTTSYSSSDPKSRFPQGLVPLVEFAFQTPLDGPSAGRTTGTINPGVIWVSRYLQAGVEAIIPVNARSGRDVGVRAQIHLYFSEIFPNTLGKPIFGK
jgi:hypothetical protein